MFKKVLETPQITLFFLISLTAFVWTTTLNYREFSPTELNLFVGYVSVLLAVELLFIGLLVSLQKIAKVFGPISKLAAAILATYNLYTLVIIHNSILANLPQLLFVLQLAAIAAALTVVFFISSQKLQKFMRTFGLVLIFLIFSQFLAGYTISKDMLRGLPDHLELVEIPENSRQNIYLISFDAFTPEPLAKRLLATEPAYLKPLKEANFRFIRNSFAERIPTKRSLNGVLAMDIAYYDSVDRLGNFIRDQVANPTYEILRANDYKVQFLFSSSYFGDDRGRLDYYGIAAEQGICTHVEKPNSFMGYCRLYIQKKLKDLINPQTRDYPELLFERIRYAAASDNPWFTMAHIYAPGHTKMSFDLRKKSDMDAYKKQFAKHARKAEQHLRNLLETVKTYDPGAILIVYGDHGAIVSMGMLSDYSELKAFAPEYEQRLASDSPLSFVDVVRDRHGVINAVYPADFCPEGFTQNPYSTTRLMRDIFKCLSGKDPLPPSYQPNDRHWEPFSYE